MKTFIFQVLVVAIVSIAASLPAAAQEKTQEAKIYLLKTGANYDTQFPSGLFTRELPSRTGKVRFER